MAVEPENSFRPTLEDLLRLKRSERPPEAFWSEFDARLREKQLAALIPVASFWSRLQFGMGRFARLAVPVAGAAAVAIGFLAYNQLSIHTASKTLGSREVEVAASNLGTTPATATSSTAQPAAALISNVADPVRTVVISASASPAISDEGNPDVHARNQILGVEEISRSLPWLANVDLRKGEKVSDFGVTGVLAVSQVPPGIGFNVSESPGSDSPAWAPTESHIRAAVASEIGLSTPQLGIRPKTWTRQTLATSMPMRNMESRIESEYRGEISRVGVTSSTLSIKF